MYLTLCFVLFSSYLHLFHYFSFMFPYFCKIFDKKVCAALLFCIGHTVVRDRQEDNFILGVKGCNIVSIVDYGSCKQQNVQHVTMDIIHTLFVGFEWP